MKKTLACTLILIILGSTSISAKPSNLNEDSIYQGVESYVNEVYVNLDMNEKNTLIKELYNEKVSMLSKESRYIDTNLESETEANELDIASEKVEREEEYIVNLINLLGENTTLDNWRFNLDYLKKNYQYIISDKDSDINYIDSYIKAYDIVLKCESMDKEKVRTTKSLRAEPSDYNGTAAQNYANRYYSNYNSSYPDWTPYGGDCANFVSQCLIAGGKGMTSNWYSYGTALNTSQVSSAWRGANEFRYNWQNSARSYKTFTTVNSTSWSYGYIGDAVSFLNSNGRATHTMIITGYSQPDFILSAHTSSTNNASLRSKASSYSSFIIFNMK